jgi:hypothetical protein
LLDNLADQPDEGKYRNYWLQWLALTPKVQDHSIPILEYDLPKVITPLKLVQLRPIRKPQLINLSILLFSIVILLKRKNGEIGICVFVLQEKGLILFKRLSVIALVHVKVHRLFHGISTKITEYFDYVLCVLVINIVVSY